MPRFLMVCMFAVSAVGAAASGPSQFYAVTVSFSDYGPSTYYRVLDIRQDGLDAVIRYVRIAPLSIYCRRPIVQAKEVRVRDTSLSELAGRTNPCLIKQDVLQRTLKRYSRTAGVFETVSLGIVAQCGTSSVGLALPDTQLLEFKRLTKARPEIARLWDLTGEVMDRVFGKDDIFHDISDEIDGSLQRTGEALVPELISGRYDSGLKLAYGRDIDTRESPSFRSLLADYRGPVGKAAAQAALAPTVVDSGAYRFSQFAPPTYPPLAMQARIQGKVELQLTVNAGSGEVKAVRAVSGHRLLAPSAISAAERWRFAPSSVAGEILNVTLDFAIRCP